MRFRVPLPRHQPIFAPALHGLPAALAAVALISVFAVPARQAHAQDKIIGNAKAPAQMKLVEGEVLRATPDSVVIKVGGNEFGIPKAFIDEVRMAPPKNFQAGSDAYAAGDYKKALPLIRPIAERFKGLPTDWAANATSMLGDLLVETGDLKGAAAAYKDFRTFYPSSTQNVKADVGEARLIMAGKDTDKNAKAKALLDPIAEKALQAKTFTKAEGAAYGQTFLLLGQLNESEQNYAEALQDYLRTVTIFNQDTGAFGEAERRVEALQTAHAQVVVP